MNEANRLMKGNVSLMTPSQKTWSEARNRLVAAVTALGFPEELAELMARQLQSPRAIDRMTSFVLQVQPHTEELLVDEMLAICDQVDTWRRKKESEEAQAKYNAMLFYRRNTPEEEDSF